MFHFAHDFTHVAFQLLFLCSTCLHSEPLHFVSKPVENFPASLNHLSLKNKLTLYLSRYIWKSIVPELQKSHGYAGITREEGLQTGQSVRKVSCQHTT